MCNSRQCIFICTEVKETLLVKPLDVLATLFPVLLFLCKSSTHSCATPLKLLCLRTWWGFQPSLNTAIREAFLFPFKTHTSQKTKRQWHITPTSPSQMTNLIDSLQHHGIWYIWSLDLVHQSLDVIQRRLHVKWKQKGGGMGRVEGGKRSKPNTSVLRTINSKTVLGLAFVFSMTGIARLRTWLQTLPSCTSIGSQDQVFQMICPISLSWYL